ncbi:NAD(+) diphosphatase [Microbacterium pseudoresistens]|uniref:NAD(+) diphosphatase n=1 Tax=Microbacterium pseudoresistens TaxID=640634 RepID=A0A7Y9ESA1_9MICO|nr:NAD(+) diphosphatase [Microbacterium pseudoresistens]NYD52998.1 NAD+ diphosphatase [Microbacterium pseudoresistens]
MITMEGLLDRAGADRDAPGILERLLADDTTRVLVVHARRAAVRHDGLALLAPTEVPALESAQWALLGRRVDGSALVLAVLPAESDTSWHPEWGGVRERASALAADEVEILLTGIALADWLEGASFCSACGSTTTLRQAGWSRRCDGCGTDLFPRTDPAVIVAVESADGERLLLGANATWKGAMYSCFAGFVEAGESLETTVHREIAEESGVRLRDVRYRSSQPWPFPHSLMVGFRATAVDETAAHGDGEEIVDVRWLTRAEIASSLRGDGPVGLPGSASIARALIIDWLGDAESGSEDGGARE